MARDLLKLGLTLAFLIIVAIAVALLVSSYLSAYSPGGQAMKNRTSTELSGKPAQRAAPSPTPAPQGVSLPVPIYPQPQRPVEAAQPPMVIQQAMPLRPERPPVQQSPTPEPPAMPEPGPGTIEYPSSANMPYIMPYMVCYYDLIQQLYWMIISAFWRQPCVFPAWPAFWWP